MNDSVCGGNGATRQDPSPTTTLPLDSGARSAGSALAVDTVWMDRYQVRKVLGSGASAAVFEAVDLQTQREVALKVLRSRHPTALARLKAEFRTLAQIAHPNLVVMHELWVDQDARGVISMELVRGESFLDYVRPSAHGRRDDARLRAALEQLVRGVRYLHAHGCLHKDLKPSNVLVSAHGQLTIVDFGLAQSTRDAADGGFEGTPAYAAPEQVDGERVSAASDWYAVGSMLYEALCGQRPFTGPNAELLARKAAGDPAPPSVRTREPVPAELESVCLRLMAREPSERAHGGDVLALLGADSHVPELWQPAIIGREAELAALEHWFARRGQERRALAILGDSGAGKTSLAAAFLEGLRTHDRARILSGRCFVHEAVAYNAFDEIVEALSHWLRQLSDAARDAVLPLELGPLSRLFPALQGLRRHERPSEPPSTRDASNERGRAFRGLRKLLERLAAEHPLLLHIDDLHWADDDSLTLLSELLTDPVPGLWLLVSARDSAPLSAAAQACETLVLGPLSDEAVEGLAREQLPDRDPSVAGTIAREAAGHPLLAKELIAHARRSGAGAGVTPGSVGLASALRERLSLLSAPARTALELLCVAGQPMPRSYFLEMGADAGVDLAALRELRVACALRESLREGVILVEAYHDSIRQLVAADIAAGHARAPHLQLARCSSALGERYLEFTVHHYVSGGEWRLAAQLAERAAARAAASLALHRAAELLELALRAVECDRERDRLQLAAADACARAGRNLAAAQHYEAAAERETGLRRSELQQRALTAYYVSGESRRGRRVLEQLAAAAQLSLEPRPISAARGFAELMLMLFSGLPYLRRPNARFLPARPSPSAAEDLQVLWGAAATLTPIDPMASVQFGARALALAARTGNEVIYGQAAVLHLGIVPGMFNQRFGLVERRFDQARQLAQHSSDFWDDAYVRVAQGSAALLASEHAPALDAVLEIAQIPQLRTPFSAHVRTSARIVSLLSLYWLGRITQLSELSQAWLEDALDAGDRIQENAFRCMRCYAHLQHDRVDKALAEIERADTLRFDFIAGHGADPWWFAGVAQYRGDAAGAADLCRRRYAYYHVYARYCASARAEWNLALGGSAAALALRDIERGPNMKRLHSQMWRARFGIGRVVRPIAAQLTATHAALTGRRSRAIAALTRSVEQYDALGMQLHAAAARLALARLARRDATAHERAAMNVFRAERIARPELWSRFLVPGLIE